jgi:branched-chain amino acid transport system substrate-binding protein
LAATNFGRIRGISIEVVVVNVQCSESGGRGAARTLTNDPNIVGVIGPTCATACAASVTEYEDAHYTLVSPSCGSGSLTDQVTHEGAFLRTIYGDQHEGRLAAQFAYNELGARRTVVIDDGTLETTELAEAFALTFAGLGGEVALRGLIEPDQTDMSVILTDIEAASPDLIFAPLRPDDAVTLATQKTGSQVNATRLLGGRHYWSKWFLDNAGSAANQVYAIGPVLSGSQFDELRSLYQTTYENEIPIGRQFAYAYDATMILLEAIKEVADASQGSGLRIGRQALRTAVYSTVAYNGVTGRLTCTAWGDCSVPALGVGQVRGGEWVTIFIP